MDILINNLTWHIDFIDDDKIQMNGENGSIFFGKTEYIYTTNHIDKKRVKQRSYKNDDNSRIDALLFVFIWYVKGRF